ncbi:c6 zinc finger domain containing protein [Ophiostoma piceae UAMH 11346]|uniref:C6 zinc finger domain containing protein n=1 Tax=Ophiostoma piceae (strain UAMH 11346) TaxID=1262450 RepID=S3BWB6_OPHP1|nr:c6 zinc finger domain containing protein [Ophiostoma piceae UAMH 11346]
MGRAPTSGNCHTCRQRRVKCDKARPACDRCARGGFVCQGYETVLRIQNHAAVSGAAPGSLRLAKVQNFSSYPVAETKAKTPRTAAARASQFHASQSKTPSSTSPSESTGSAGSTVSAAFTQRTPPLVPQPNLIGFVDDMATSYFFQSYGWINMHSILLQDAAMQRYFVQPDTRRVSGSSGSLDQDSLRALCYGLLGRDKHIPALQDAGRRVYGRAIAQLRATITTSSKDELTALVKPISLLGSYSVAVERDLRFTHHTGLARILEVCGPEYFQSPDILPVFESVRMTLVADAVIRRQPTFLAQPQWKTLPWAGSCSSSAKSATSRLLDIMAVIPSIIQSVWGIMSDRVQWLAGGGHEGYLDVPRLEHPDAVARLQARVLHEIREPAAAWHHEWTASSELAPRVLAWAYARGGGDDAYRPGLFGVQGPDAFNTLVDGVNGDGIDDFSFSPAEVGTLMQDAALYTTVLVWAVRMDRYLARAAQSMSCVDFFSKPFRSGCTCSNMLQCETVPPVSSGDLLERSMAWNVSTCVAVGPVRFSPAPEDEASASPHAFKGDSLLPGDIRFVAHMRILAWLSRRLPATRGAMLATLAAVGLAHCAHDVRPAEGHTEIAAVAVARVLDSTGVDGAADILLKRYQHVDV